MTEPGPSLTAGVVCDKVESKPSEIRSNLDQHQTQTLEEELLLAWPCDTCTHKAPLYCNVSQDSVGLKTLHPLTK